MEAAEYFVKQAAKNSSKELSYKPEANSELVGNYELLGLQIHN